MFKPQFQKRQVMVFHQFQRKGYSLFAALGREVIISVLSVATLSATKAASISDETFRVDSTKATAREVTLDDVCVTGSRAPLTVSQAARMVTVLSREDIAQAPVQSVNDLLKMAVGVDVRQRGPLGSQTDISIRGGTQEQIVVLLNGINICDPQTGHNTFDLPCDLSDIIRIEVLEGPAGRVYGTSSLVGAINIVTSSHRKKGKSVEFDLEAGSFGYVKVGAAGNYVHRQVALASRLSCSYARSDGYSRSKAGRLNTDFSGSKAFYQGSYDDSQIKLLWHAGLSDKGRGAGTFYATPRWQADEQYEHTTKVHTALQGENKNGSLHFQPSIYWNHFQDRYEGYRGQPNVMKYNYNRCDVYGLKINSYFDWLCGRTALGAEIRNEDLVSGNLGEPLSRPHHISGTDRDYTLGVNRTNISAHLEHNVIFDHLAISAGFVAAKSSWSNMNMTIYPGVDVSYMMGDVKLFASYNSSLRLPSFTEMYYKLQGYAAEPHLKPEEMQALEVGSQIHTILVNAKISAYYHHGTNMIDWIMDTNQGDQAQWQSVNHTQLNAYGLEASLQIPSKIGLFDVSYSYIYQDKANEPGIVSQYALEYLRHKLVAGLQTKEWKGISMRLNCRWQDRVGTYTSFDGVLSQYTPYALVDARIQKQSQHYTMYLEANNLFDNRSYIDFGNVQQPGLWIVSGITLRF